MVMFCPSLRPCSRKPCRKFSIHIGGGGPIRRKPIRLTLPGCCARAMSGHAAAALPRRVMNSRLLTRAPHMHDADIRLSDLRSRGAPRLLRCSEPSPAMTVVGLELSIHHPGQNSNLATAYPSTADLLLAPHSTHTMCQ